MAIEELTSQGWEVHKKGWPDFLVVRDGVIRLIEVKPKRYRKLSKAQSGVAYILRSAGLNVEIWAPPVVVCAEG